jgi:hypothetical protein
MKYFEDDSRKYAEIVWNMPREERQKIIREYELQLKKDRFHFKMVNKLVHRRLIRTRLKWFEDDSYTIPDYIRNMSKKQLEVEIKKSEEQARRNRDILHAVIKKAIA